MLSPSPPPAAGCIPLPVVVHVGFAGSRNLYPPDHPDAERIEGEIADRLGLILRGIAARFDLSPRHFICGISQIAIGGDMLFTRACGSEGVPQRIFLPQNRVDFLDATGANGVPDFTRGQKLEATRLLELPHIIQERVISDAPERTDRFEDTNLEILRSSDLLVCLLRPDVEAKPGGTAEMRDDALLLKKPVLELTVAIADGRPAFTEKWHNAESWRAPVLPHDLDSACVRATPSVAGRPAPPPPLVPVGIASYLKALKDLGSITAEWRQKIFRTVALTVIIAHLLATVCAVVVLKLDHIEQTTEIVCLLGAELALLVAGFLVHRSLHRSHVVRLWAVSRLAAEVARSVESVRELHFQLGYLFSLPFPESLRPLLRTLNVLHLASTRRQVADPQGKRDRYLARRVDGRAQEGGQIDYYERKLAKAAFRLSLASWAFVIACVGAILATGAKFGMELDHKVPPSFLGVAAVVLPVAAVGALSLAASFDLEARVHTFTETRDYLKLTRPYLAQVRSERALCHLVLQVESRLLGETAAWFSRRLFTGVT